jgi:hypothetical protein
MARYREKSPEDLRWNRIRRRLTRELDIQLADWREEALNVLLTGAFHQYVEALDSGKKLELEGQYKSWVAEALDQELRELLAGPSAPVG